MSVFTSTPFSLTFDQLIKVKIVATNVRGSSDESTINTTGAKIRRVPSQITTLSVASFSDTFITLQWTALSSPDNGNSDILTYQLYYDNNSGTVDQLYVQTTDTSVKVNGLTTGLAYKFTVTATNVYGESTPSSEVT